MIKKNTGGRGFRSVFSTRELRGWGDGKGCKSCSTEPAPIGAVLWRASEGQGSYIEQHRT